MAISFNEFINKLQHSNLSAKICLPAISNFRGKIKAIIQQGLGKITAGDLSKDNWDSDFKDAYDQFLLEIHPLLSIALIIQHVQSNGGLSSGTWIVGINGLQNERNPTWNSFQVDNVKSAEKIVELLTPMGFKKENPLGIGGAATNYSVHVYRILNNRL